MTTSLEKLARKNWLDHAGHVHFGRCDVCKRVRDEDGKPLLVAKQERARKFECLDCWDAA